MGNEHCSHVTLLKTGQNQCDHAADVNLTSCPWIPHHSTHHPLIWAKGRSIHKWVTAFAYTFTTSLTSSFHVTCVRREQQRSASAFPHYFTQKRTATVRSPTNHFLLPATTAWLNQHQAPRTRTLPDEPSLNSQSRSTPCSTDNFFDFAQAVTWLPHGRAFRIHNKTKFMEEVVPVFFNQTKIRSFNRQLHLWGFHR